MIRMIKVGHLLMRFENLNTIIKSGKIRYIGLSNETPWGILKFLKLSETNKLPRVASVPKVTI